MTSGSLMTFRKEKDTAIVLGKTRHFDTQAAVDEER